MHCTYFNSFCDWLQSGGPYWDVESGRRDSFSASRNDANNDIPKPTFNVPQLVANFNNVGLTEKDVVALSGNASMLNCLDRSCGNLLRFLAIY